MFQKKKIAFDINFEKNDVEIFYNNTEIFSNLENILDKKLCFDISFQKEFINVTFENVSKVQKGK